MFPMCKLLTWCSTMLIFSPRTWSQPMPGLCRKMPVSEFLGKTCQQRSERDWTISLRLETPTRCKLMPRLSQHQSARRNKSRRRERMARRPNSVAPLLTPGRGRRTDPLTMDFEFWAISVWPLGRARGFKCGVNQCFWHRMSLPKYLDNCSSVGLCQLTSVCFTGHESNPHNAILFVFHWGLGFRPVSALIFRYPNDGWQTVTTLCCQREMFWVRLSRHWVVLWLGEVRRGGKEDTTKRFKDLLSTLHPYFCFVTRCSLYGLS